MKIIPVRQEEKMNWYNKNVFNSASNLKIQLQS